MTLHVAPVAAVAMNGTAGGLAARATAGVETRLPDHGKCHGGALRRAVCSTGLAGASPSPTGAKRPPKPRRRRLIFIIASGVIAVGASVEIRRAVGHIEAVLAYRATTGRL